MGQIRDYLGGLLGTSAMSNGLNSLRRIVVEGFNSVHVRIQNLETLNMTLAETIKVLVAVEIEEGKKLLEANVKLVEALGSANDKVQALEAALASQPELLAELATLKDELGLAEEAAELISSINPSSVSDGIVDEVIADPEIETPSDVENAPETSVETIPDLSVVESAINAFD